MIWQTNHPPAPHATLPRNGERFALWGVLETSQNDTSPKGARTPRYGLIKVQVSLYRVSRVGRIYPVSGNGHPHSEASMQAYSDESRADDPHTLPDVEVFYRTAAAIRADEWRDEDGEYMGEGWYAWSCFPGCLPDSDPVGPFLTAQAAQDAMRGDASC